MVIAVVVFKKGKCTCLLVEKLLPKGHSNLFEEKSDIYFLPKYAMNIVEEISEKTSEGIHPYKKSRLVSVWKINKIFFIYYVY